MSSAATAAGTRAAWTTLAGVLLAALACGEGTTRPPPATGTEACPDASFQATILPLFDAECHQCHRTSVSSGGLDLDGHAAVMAGGDSGAAVIPGDCAASLLYQTVTWQTQPYMPPDRALSEADAACVCAWIELGALDD